MDDQIVSQSSLTSTKSALKKTLDVVCGKWRLYIIFQLGTEARRYGELRRMIPDVSEKVLIQELKALVSLGVLEKKSYNEIPPRVEYCLSTRGLRVLPTLLNLITVGETFLNVGPLDKYGLPILVKDGKQVDGADHKDGKSLDGHPLGKYGVPSPFRDGKQVDGARHEDGMADGARHEDGKE